MKSISIFAHFLHVNMMSLGLEELVYFKVSLSALPDGKSIKKLNIMITLTLPSCFMLGLKSTLVTVSL